jgi:hypothetical protein
MTVSLAGGKGIRVQWRASGGEQIAELRAPSRYALPVCLKLKKVGAFSQRLLLRGLR